MKKENVFCDWMTVSQTHDFDVANHIEGINIYVDGETGDIKYESGKSKQVRGSYDTAINVQAFGRRVSVSGNIGRFGRLDNVFGYSVVQCQTLVNDLLESLDLPPFTGGEQVDSSGARGIEPSRWYSGAKMSRLDLTVNYETGSQKNSVDYLYWLRSQKIGKLETSFTNNTVYFGKNSGFKTIKAYLKGPEMHKRRHLKNRLPSIPSHSNVIDILSGLPSKESQQLTDEDLSYRDQLANWCNDVGIVRVEAVLKQKFLNQYGLKHWATITDERIQKFHRKSVEELMNRCDSYSDIRNQKPAIQNAIHAYLRGENMRELGWSRATYYRYRKLILECGIDIDTPLNVRALTIRPRVIELRAAQPPEFYQLPKVA